MPTTIFIDGQAGTTALQIRERLAAFDDVELLLLDEAERKDPVRRRDAINDADVAFLCLPDAAAIEAASFVSSDRVRLIDASTAHRVHPDWVYGLPEYTPDWTGRIADARRVSNPGCYPTGCILLLAPLVRAGVIPGDYPVSIFAVSGYTGGGRSMIERFEDPNREDRLDTPHRLYGLDLSHKHVPEIQKYALLERRPIFVPSVGRFPQGMSVTIPINGEYLGKPLKRIEIEEMLAEYYAGYPHVIVETGTEATHLDADALAGSDDIKLYVLGNDERDHILLCAVLDNLGKGASGAAVQNLGIMLGL